MSRDRRDRRNRNGERPDETEKHKRDNQKRLNRKAIARERQNKDEQLNMILTKSVDGTRPTHEPSSTNGRAPFRQRRGGKLTRQQRFARKLQRQKLEKEKEPSTKKKVRNVREAPPGGFLKLGSSSTTPAVGGFARGIVERHKKLGLI